MKQTLDTFEQFANNLYQENLRGFYELESMKFGIMARLGLDEPDALELACVIVARSSDEKTTRGKCDEMHSNDNQRQTV